MAGHGVYGIRNHLMKRMRTGHYDTNHKDTLRHSSNLSGFFAVSQGPDASVSGLVSHGREQAATLLLEAMEAEKREQQEAEDVALESEREFAASGKSSLDGRLQRQHRQAKEAAAARIRAMVNGEDEQLEQEQPTLQTKERRCVTEKDSEQVRLAAAARIRAALDIGDDTEAVNADSTDTATKPSESFPKITSNEDALQDVGKGHDREKRSKEQAGEDRAAAAARIRAMLLTEEVSEEDGSAVPATAGRASGTAKLIELNQEVAGDASEEGAASKLEKAKSSLKRSLEDPKRKAAEEEAEKRKLQRERRMKQRMIVL